MDTVYTFIRICNAMQQSKEEAERVTRGSEPRVVHRPEARHRSVAAPPPVLQSQVTVTRTRDEARAGRARVGQSSRLIRKEVAT